MLTIVISYHHAELANAKVHIALRMLKLPPKKYNASTKSWITSRICALYLAQLDKEKWVLKIKRFLPFIDHCAAGSKNTFLRTIKAMFFPGNCTSHF